MPVSDFPPPDMPIREAEENLRIIRDLMERSTRHSTFSGLAGVLAGIYCIGGCVAQLFLSSRSDAWMAHPVTARLELWFAVAGLAIGTDVLLNKRHAARVGKTIRSRLGKQMLLAAAPALGTGALLTFFFAVASHQMSSALFDFIYPFWMLCYGSAICAVGVFSQKEVARLGWAFLAAGAVTFGTQLFLPGAYVQAMGLWMMALAFGGFHIVYGIAAARRDGW